MVVCLILVTHGSLYPWEFVAPASFAVAWSDMWRQDSWWTSLGDVVGNVVLFVPVGVLGVLVQDRARALSPWRLAFLMGWGMALAVALQVLQVWIPSRSAAFSDAMWNLAGLLIGATIAGAARPILGQAVVGRVSSPGAPLTIVMLWMVIEWWPFLPTIDWQHVKDALKPLLLAPRWNWHSFVEVSLGLGVAMNFLRDHRARMRIVLAMIAAAALGKLLISGQTLSVSHSLGWIAGLALGAGLWRCTARRAAMITLWTALTWFTLDELRPFVPADAASSFTWIPFVASLKGSLIVNTLALCWNSFWLGAVMVCARSFDTRMGGLAATLGVWTLMLEGTQVWLPGRVADVTPALLPALWWLVLEIMDPPPLRGAHC